NGDEKWFGHEAAGSLLSRHRTRQIGFLAVEVIFQLPGSIFGQVCLAGRWNHRCCRSAILAARLEGAFGIAEFDSSPLGLDKPFLACRILCQSIFDLAEGIVQCLVSLL